MEGRVVFSGIIQMDEFEELIGIDGTTK